MRTYLLNPTLKDMDRYIREGRCMQKASSWATSWPPVTLGVLAALAKKFGEVRLTDGNIENISLEDLVSEIKKFNPDLVVVNTGFPSIEKDMWVASKIREAFPQMKILAFGVYFSLLKEESLEKNPHLDFAIAGEPEETFEELMSLLDSKSADIKAIKGLLLKENSSIHFTGVRSFLKNLDKLPFPARDLIRNDRYRLPHNNKTFTLINVARGCPYPCIYCIVPPYLGAGVRKHSVDYVMREIRESIEHYGIEEFLFWEEVFTLDKKFAFELCEAIEKNKFNIKWAATTRVGLIEDDLLKAMKKAGCYLLGLGIESGNQEILDRAKKKQTLEEIRRAVDLCKKNGIQTMGHFIFGLPGETKQTAKKTIDFMLSLGLNYMQGYCAVPYPGTEFGEMAVSNGWIQTDKWSEYDFGGNSVANIGTIKPEEVTFFREKAFRSFYFRLSYIFNNVLKNIPLKQLLKIVQFTNWIQPRKQPAKKV